MIICRVSIRNPVKSGLFGTSSITGLIQDNGDSVEAVQVARALLASRQRVRSAGYIKTDT